VLLLCVAPPVSQLFSVCIAIIWSVLLLAGNALASSAPVRRSTVCCRRRCPLRRFCCLHVSPVLSNRLSVYRVLSPQLSSSSVLLLSCIARPQPPPVSHGKSCVNRLSRWRWPGQVAAKTQTNLGSGDNKDCTKPIGGQARKRSLLGVGGR